MVRYQNRLPQLCSEDLPTAVCPFSEDDIARLLEEASWQIEGQPCLLIFLSLQIS